MLRPTSSLLMCESAHLSCSRVLHEEAEEANAKPKCKTEKDRSVRLNARTAGIVHTILHTDIHVSIQICFYSGILAVMWPCGVIVHVSELFTAESKTQVYGQLHDLLWTHPRAAMKLSKYVTY